MYLHSLLYICMCNIAFNYIHLYTFESTLQTIKHKLEIIMFSF